jgi:fatty acid desaturase
MAPHFHFDLGKMPPAGWVAFIAIISILIGYFMNIPILFYLGIIVLVIILILAVIAMIAPLFGK